MVLNLSVWLGMAVLQARDADAYERVMDAMAIDPAFFRVQALFTHLFTHVDSLHVLSNMLFLWVFGNAVEDKLGRWWFLLFYLVGGTAAGGVHCLLSPSPAVGASGAVAAVGGAYLILFPLSQVRLLFFVSVITVPAWWFVGFCIVHDIYLVSYRPTGSNIAAWAHVGGYVSGIMTAVLLLATGMLKQDAYDMTALIGRYRRRRAFRASIAQHEREVKRAATKADATTTIDQRRSTRLAEIRASLSATVAREDLDSAAALYDMLLSEFRDQPRACVLSGKNQLALANHLFSRERHAPAADAYEGFLILYPNETDSPRVRVMLALVAWRRLGDAKRAEAAIGKLDPAFVDEQLRSLAVELKGEIAAAKEQAHAAAPRASEIGGP